MTQLGPFLVLIFVFAIALAALGGVIAWYNEEGRRIRRGLRKVLKGETHALIVAYGRGRGAGFNFTSNTMAVTWDAGEWCLIYRLEELQGVELIADGQVAGRAFRNETRRPVDVLGGADKQVSLRLVFDDPQHADFLLELWSAARPARRGTLDAAQAVEEGNRWLARLESVFRRQAGGGARVAPRPAQSEPARAEPARAEPARAEPPPFTLEAEPAPAAPAPAAEPQREPQAAAFALEAEPEPEPARPPPAAPAASRAAGRQELPFGADDEPPWDEDDEDDQQALL